MGSGSRLDVDCGGVKRNFDIYDFEGAAVRERELVNDAETEGVVDWVVTLSFAKRTTVRRVRVVIAGWGFQRGSESP